ncbi:hypothetical protein D9757_012736 [Collybiopsis confluens]|uniref:Uncharacterized protein n=1 Tax=Collybiopsis confluens TaxID=2823264 RepID=A0A8H5D4M3_9AGAR|nr:hypothetical protein D9757_012736 [Collybiopsis confluens]
MPSYRSSLPANHGLPPTAAPRRTRQSTGGQAALPFNHMIALHHPHDIRALYKEFRHHISSGKMVTFDLSTRQFKIWTPPLRQAVSGVLSTASPLSYVGMLGYCAPKCPHALNPFLRTADCTMVVRPYCHNGTTKYVFLAPHPGCEFRMPIPWFGVERFDPDVDDAYNEDEDDIDLVSSAYISQSANTSMEDMDDTLFAFIEEEPGSSPVSSENIVSPSRPQPVALKKGKPTLSSFFTAATAERRASYDREQVKLLTSAFCAGVFEDFPALHPAYFLSKVPAILAPYDPAVNSGTRTFNHLQYLETAIGKVIRAANSNLGATPTAYRELLSLSQSCGVCLAVYSPDGYQAHVENNDSGPRCQNTPGCPPVSEHQIVVVDPKHLPERTFLNNQQPAFGDSIDSALGRPFLEWNSKLGIPADVWAMVSTAVIACEACKLVRTFAADKAHRAIDGFCMDPGCCESDDDSRSNPSISSRKGKQRAVD